MVVVIKQLQAAQASDAYRTYTRTDASRVGGVGTTKRRRDERWSRWWDERKLALPGAVMVSKK